MSFKYFSETYTGEFEAALSVYNYENYRSGINVVEYLLDVVNYISGYHESQLQEESIGFSVEELDINKLNKEETEEHDKDNEETIEEFNSKIHKIQSVLVLESIQSISKYVDAEERASNWIQHLILRLYNNTGYRNHFPIIMETNNCYYYENEMYTDLWDHKWTIPALFYQPKQYILSVKSYLDGFLNNSQREYIADLYKDSQIYYYDALAKSIQAKGVQGFIESIQFKSDIHVQDYNAFKYKINSLYANPRLQKYLDSAKIDYIITDAINQWRKLISWDTEPELNLRKRKYDFDYLRQDITLAMLEENILIYERYNQKVKTHGFLYNYYFEEAAKSMIANKFTYPFKRVMFLKYSIFDAFVFRLNFMSIGKKPYLTSMFMKGEEYKINKWLHGYNIKYDVPMELYKGQIPDKWMDDYGFKYEGVK
eukprot:CAMPEP_0170516388 /NCGR_PEP_ID=MMETSP0209-20121228/2614_1 /TAXON_ID=665100 ORGANISM="Litonotus pictus, Strain P1" /NCGR_SAMPLE_ID=MMETSP0209 /ASSEMBLY_ACC=CAM_ASM_000301 /LENGTH=425 /DNA_ID=CAMNT_0010801253 /DNA_START=918 /DNA_END=2195 /DNA_ORIENTATION=+